MSASTERMAEALRVSLKEAERLRQRNQRLREAAREPIAIVGMSCRLPGAVASPRDLWELVASGTDAISEFPTDRGWDLDRLYDPDPDQPNTSYAREGGFVYDAGGFDPAFFGVSSYQARVMDPQLRLLLEASWNALEDAGIDPRTLRGTQTGVFAGAMYHDYGWLGSGASELADFLATGGTSSVISGHVAYTLGLEGPTMTVDTACSSSLVAIHLAGQALRGGECSLALAGGVTVLATPSIFTQFSRQRGLSPDGRCKSFAEAADGAGFSEGVGTLLLERLSDAQRNGRRILAVIRGSAVNQDGASNGLTAPNGPSQERVIRQALANAGLEPKDVDAVEGHGTGTTLGDPIEARALLATYGQDREQPLRLGSIKSNIGHTQAAAGVAGVIKMALAMREGVLPKTLHVDAPSSKVDWEAGGIELLSEPAQWQSDGRPRRAGISSFGASGTNAHVILEQAPEPSAEQTGGDADGGEAPVAEPLSGPIPLALSAKAEPALAQAAERLAAHLQENPELDPVDVAYSLLSTRSAFEHRAVALGNDKEELLEALEALTKGEPSPNLLTSRAKQGKLAWLLTGQGSQRLGMGKELYEADPHFKEALERICEALDQHLETPLKEIVFAKGKKAQARLEDTTYAQPALFALELALHEVLAKGGLKPEILAGHSVGEIAAAHISGVLELADAAKLICARGALMGALPKGGAMAAIEATEQEIAESIAGREAELSIAAINGPSSTVISGAEQAVEQIRGQWEEKGRKTKRLAVSHAFHSPLMEPMLAELAEVAGSLAYHEPKIPIVSNLTGEILTAEQATDPAYWVRHAREAVRFADTVATLKAQGATTFLELGPDPVLCAMARESLGEEEGAAFVPTLREGRPEAGATTRAIAAAHAAGAKVEWGAFFAGTGAKRVALPTYPFQRQRYWLDSALGSGDLGAAGLIDVGHPLLAAAIEDPSDGGMTLTGRISLATHPWLADHRVGEAVVLPGAAFLELALRAAEEVGARSVEELILQAPLVLPEEGAVVLRVSVGAPGEDGGREIAMHSRPDGEDGVWVQNAAGALSEHPAGPAEPLGAWPPEDAEPLDTADAYEILAERGLRYGPAFQGLTAAWRDGERVYAEVSLPEGQVVSAGRFGLHPVLLDSALHAAALTAASAGAGEVRLPFSWGRVSLSAGGATLLRVMIEPLSEGEVSLVLADAAGVPVATVASLVARPVDLRLPAGSGVGAGLLEVEWQEIPSFEEDAGLAQVEVLACEIDRDTSPSEAARKATEATLDAIQQWLAGEPKVERRLALLTEGAMAALDGESPDPAAATIWGLVRSAQSEHPGRFALIDSDGSEASEAALPAALAMSAKEPQLALRGGEALAPRLARRTPEGQEAGAVIDPERTVLVSGATGGLGPLVARHLVERHGARRLLLVSRSGSEAEGAEELKRELEQLGAEAEIAACDVSEPKALKGLLTAIPDEHPLGAVIHCAGAIDDGTVESLDGGQIGRVFAPKVDAGWNLHELTADSDLSAFVLFSSAAGTLGGPGQANYAAANVFLDALAQKRQAEGRPAISIAWGLWERQDGMASGMRKADIARMRRAGIEPISDARGMALFDSALASAAPQSVAAPLNAAGLRAIAAAGALPPIFSGLVRMPRRAAATGSLAAKLVALSDSEVEPFVLELVRSEVAAVLGHATAAEIDPGRAFQELGFDSLAAVELRNRLDTVAGVRLAATVVFDYPNSAALAEHLLAEATASGAGGRVAVRAQATDEPIAIVGMACRYPGGVSSPEELWRLVAEGRDGISEFPADRGWDVERIYDPDPESVGTSYTREGGFMTDAGHFDAEFFGISPREAQVTDPQQRLLLESCWEALEDAGIDPVGLRKSQTGVFAGVMYQDYGPAAGMTQSIVSGRVSYALGLEGPAITVDTACSSSLVAMHLASQALRGGECTLALAGGVTTLSTPGVFVEFSRQRGLAPDGRSKSFAEAADGVAWAEGVGVLVLERLSEAERNGHPVLALLKGSAVNQDGASNGLTAPNGPSQERVIRQALANARLESKDIDVVEGHGTGTTLGDPIEAGALLATYGQERDEPLKLGSIKSNIGHTQAAAGVAGVIKMALAMREGVLPKTLHVDAPSSKVDWEAGEIELLSEQLPWEPDGKPRRAGISSFGISGTNAHVILEQAPEPGAVEASENGDGGSAASEPLQGPIPLALSAKAEPALAQAAERLAAHLQENPELDPVDVAYSLLSTRSAFEHRAVALGNDKEELLEALEALTKGEPSPNLLTSRAKQGKLAWLLTGQGSQRLGMGKELYEADPHFKQAFDAVCEQIDQQLETPLREIVFAKGKKAQARLEDTTYAQPALFALELALHEVLAKGGLKPEILAGHSVGEIAAAHISGVLELADAAKLICARGALMGALPKGGAMAAIEATEQEIAESIAGREAELSIAAINGPSSTVISGAEQAVEQIRGQWEEKGRKTKRLAVSHAFHSPLMEPMLAELAEVAGSLAYHEPKIPIVSNLTGEILTAEQATDPAYWVRHAREAVRFADTVATLRAQGATTFLELGPDPVLCAMARECLGEEERAAFVPTLREGRPEAGATTRAIAAAHAAGAKVEWGAFFAASGAKRVALPTYPFQRQRYWLDSALGSGDLGAAGLIDVGHPLLAAAIEDPSDGGMTLTGRISLATHSWLADHRVGEAVVLPGAAFLELALRAAEEVGAQSVDELTLQAPLVMPKGGAVALQVSVSAAGEGGRREISIHSRPEVAEGEWVENAAGSLSEQAPEEVALVNSWPPEGAEPLDVTYAYDLLAELGLEYGPAFRGLRAAWREGERIHAEVSLPEGQAQDAERFALHPALLDAALHSIALVAADSGSAELRLPFSWSGVSLQAVGARELRVTISPRSEGEISLVLADPGGGRVATVASLAARPLDPSQLQSDSRPAPERLLALEWTEVPLGESGATAPGLEVLACRTPAGAPATEAARSATETALEAIQTWLAEDAKADRLVLLTEGATTALKGESPDPAAASIWGLVRSAQSEHPGRFALIDSDGSEASEKSLAAALAASGEEPQLALREGTALAPRAMPVKDSDASLVPPPGVWRLDAPQRGTLESLTFVPSAPAPLGPAGVRIQMRAAGLNFRDLLVALGVYPGEAVIGSEGAGVVLETGPEVGDLAPGDRVMGLIPQAFAPLASSERDLLVQIPEGWTFEQAAATPLTYATALYGLVDLAGLEAGERVLIHAGAGGVGTAAIEIACHLGAEVFATASPGKWEVLRQAGLDDEHIASSRDLEFEEKFLQTTDGGGVDVVLNALAGEFVDASLGLLPSGGRFLEMGKTDVRDPAEVAEAHKGVSYRAFDLVEAGPERTREMLTELVALFERGEVSHPPISTWDMREAPQAFRRLREGRNVGKLVLSVPRTIDPERTVLITGGTGALGALVASHLAAEHGARRLLLVSRSGADAEGAAELQAGLEDLKAEVRIAACDVSKREALEELLASIPAEHPLGAVVHCAGAIADGTVETLSPGQIDQVFTPKVDAAWHLHELTADLDLSTFVLFSSAAGTLGGPGQGNYAAANVFLDALAQRRQAEGRPATSIAWGLWEREGGMASQLRDADLARLRRGGVGALSDERGLALLDAALSAGRAEALAMPVEAAGLAALAAAGALPPVLSGLVRTPRRRRAVAGSLAAKLATLADGEVDDYVLDLVRGEVAGVLGHGAAVDVEPNRAFQELGFDSLAAVELRNRLSARAGVRLSATVVFDYPSSAALAEYLLGEVSAGGVARQVAVRAQTSEEPIAIVGMACRYPGGIACPEDLWRLVAEGRDGISEFPADRGWDLERLYDPDRAGSGTSYTREGGFVAGAAEFDASFFGISPREALAMDPQQRLLLEACWEALEDAGIDPVSLRKTPSGVFAGLIHQVYSAGPAGAASEFDGYRATGNTASVASGRVAYALGLEGPAITIDTACSSSLVAMHLASQALRGGECTLALAGGVTIFPNPGMFTEFSAQRGLAPDGRCKSFAEAADGTSWAEGVGVLVLERRSEAERNGHEVLAVLKGSAVNQDGASNGLTAPNGPSQERVIRQALANARLEPKDVDVVEAHGTGTMLGDPIEAGALLATYGQERDEPLKLGSIKSNIGHAQAASGVAGVIKMALAMREGVLPKTLHVDAPSSKVDWEAGEIELLSEPAQWETNGRPRRAGISSFGISGTNAHVILEQAPEPGAVEASENGDGGSAASEPLQGPIPLALSAKAEPALAQAAERLAAHLQENPELDPVDVAYSLLSTRSAFEHRAVALGNDKEELLEALEALTKGEPSPNLLTSRAKQGKLAWLLTGQGSQRLGMGKELYEADPHFKEALERICEALDQHLETPLKKVLFAKGKKAQARLEDTTYAQPALFALELALHEVLAKGGLKPEILAGHSVGEIAAAHISGVLELADAAKLICARGALMGALPKGGAMAAIEATEQEIAESIAGREAELSIAAINGPSSTVISGAEQAVEQIRGQWEEKGRKTKRLAVSHAFHSPLMEPMLAELAEVAGSLAYHEPKIPIVSNLTGEILTAEQATDPAYWVRHAREAVRFADTVATLRAQGATTFLELGPDPVLCAMARESLGEEERAAFVPTLREGRPEAGATTRAIAAAHAAGAKVEWGAFFAASGAKRVALPTYPFQRQRYWLAPIAVGVDVGAIGQSDPGHPLLAAAIEDPSGSLMFTGRLSSGTHPWLSGHDGLEMVLPGIVLVELVLRMASEAGCERVEELTLITPLSIPPQGAVAIQVSVSGADEEGRREIALHSRLENEEPEWSHNARGVLSGQGLAGLEPQASWPPEDAEPLDVEDAEETLEQRGLQHGDGLQRAVAAWMHEGMLYLELELYGESASPFRLRLAPEGEEPTIVAFDEEGAPLIGVRSLAAPTLTSKELRAARSRRALYRVGWSPLPETSAAQTGSEAVHSDVVEIVPAEGDVPEAAQATAEKALALLQGWIGEEARQGSRLVLVTRNAIAAGGEDAPDLAAAAVWGLVRSAISEHPGRFAVIDTDGGKASEEAMAAALQAVASEPQLALREGEVLAPRLARVKIGEEAEAEPVDPERTVLITGGLSGLGALVARHLVATGQARHLLLASRRGPGAEGAEPLRESLEELGAQVQIAACDVTERRALEDLFASVPSEHPLGAIVHSAGALDDGVLDAMDPERLARTMRPKAVAAWHLHELSRELDLSQFLLFSSAAGLLGGAAQSNYAAANNFVDALAALRHSEGLPATALAWGLWDQRSSLAGGVLADEDVVTRIGEQIRQRLGFARTEPERGLELFDVARELAEPLLAPVHFDMGALRSRAEAGSLTPLLHGLVPPPARDEEEDGSLARRLAEMPEGRRGGVVLDLVRENVAGVLGHTSAAAVDPERPFHEMGVDSLAAVELRNRLSAASGLTLPPTLVFDHPSAIAVATKLLHDVSGVETEEELREGEVKEMLAALESTLAALAPTDSVRERASTRLRSLLVSLSNVDSAQGGDSSEELASMSDQEMFELIDEEFGGGSPNGG